MRQRNLLQRAAVASVLGGFVFGGCALGIMSGTTETNVQQEMEPDGRAHLYAAAECKFEDERATEKICLLLLDHVGYGLVYNRQYSRDEASASRFVEMTITYYRGPCDARTARGLVGVLAGPEGVDVLVEVYDQKSRERVGSASISHSDPDGARGWDRDRLLEAVSQEIVQFLITGRASD